MKIDKKLFMQKVRFKIIFNYIDYKDEIYRTVMYVQFGYYKEGYIIGSKIMYEGRYIPAHKLVMYESEFVPAELINRKAVKFYRVVVGFDQEYFVNINDIIMSNE